MSGIKYRPEVDGLRAIAVIPVILFHAGIDLFSGGYVGVDVFFVISGYLITRIIMSDLDTQQFSIAMFYWRRARRILPALFLVMVCCIPFAWAWMLPTEFEEFSNSLVAVSLFSSNILFWQESGYFAIASDVKPLLHTWSLAVEEQFYMLFPLFLLLLWRFGKKTVFFVILIAAAASLGLSEWAWRNAPSANFYLAPTRAWELFAGALCAFAHDKNKASSSNPLSLIGLFLIVFSIFYYDKGTPFPSVYTLVPVLGTALILYYGSTRTVVSRLLSLKVVVGVGLISYSTYLWHHPLFAFARIKNIYEPDLLFMLLLSCLSILLGYLTWRFIEVPIKYASNIKITSVAFLGVSTAIIAFGIFGDYKLSKLIPFPPNIKWESFGHKLKSVGGVCDQTANSSYPGLELCYFGDLNSTEIFALYGDSHAEAISSELEKEFLARKIKGARIKAHGCEEVPMQAMSTFKNQHSSHDPKTITSKCLPAFKALLDYVHENAAAVILLARWSFRLYPVTGHINNLFVKNGDGGVENGNGYKEFAALSSENVFKIDAATKRNSLNHLVNSFAETKKRVLLVYPVPETSWNIMKENAAVYRETGAILDNLTISSQAYKVRNSFVISIFDRISNDYVSKIRTDKIFCDSFFPNRCAAQVNGEPLYYDDDHLSSSGARLIVNDIFREIDLMP